MSCFKVLFLVVLCGCNPFWFAAPTSEDIQANTWAKQEKIKPIKQPYCYKVLGGVECFSHKRKELPLHNRVCLDTNTSVNQKSESLNIVKYSKRARDDIMQAIDEAKN